MHANGRTLARMLTDVNGRLPRKMTSKSKKGADHGYTHDAIVRQGCSTLTTQREKTTLCATSMHVEVHREAIAGAQPGAKCKRGPALSDAYSRGQRWWCPDLECAMHLGIGVVASY